MTSVSAKEGEFKAAYILPIVEMSDGSSEVLFLHRRDPVVDGAGMELYPAGVLDLPGGGLDGNEMDGSDRENPAQAAIRELQEETGIRVESEFLVPIAAFESIDGRLVAYFRYHIPEELIEGLNVSTDEHRGHELISADQIPLLLGRNEILDIHADMALFYLTGESYHNGREIHLDMETRPWWLGNTGREVRTGTTARYIRS